jgi:hypothetical protein
MDLAWRDLDPVDIPSATCRMIERRIELACDVEMNGGYGETRTHSISCSGRRALWGPALVLISSRTVPTTLLARLGHG